MILWQILSAAKDQNVVERILKNIDCDEREIIFWHCVLSFEKALDLISNIENGIF